MTRVCEHCHTAVALPGGSLCVECFHAEIERVASEIEALDAIVVDGVEVHLS